MCNEYVMFIYLYSTACLYNKSSEGINSFCCSSSIFGQKATLQSLSMRHIAAMGGNRNGKLAEQ